MPLNRYTYNGITCRATRRRSSTRDDKKYMREVEYKGDTRLVHYGDPNLDMQRDNPERRANFLARHSCDEKRDPFAPGFWACYDWKNTSEKSMELVELKSLNDDTAVVVGYGVVFGGADLEGEAFTPETDFDLHRTKGAGVFYDHRLRDVKHKIGRITETKVDDYGLWIEAELDRHEQYTEAVLTLVERGALGWSTGSTPHLVEKSAEGIIKTWPIAEISLTPTPAEPRTKQQTQRVKSAEEAPEADTAAVQSDIVETKQPQIEVLDMDDQTKTPTAVDERIASLEATTKATNEMLKSLLEQLEKPKPQAVMKQMGYFAPDSTGGEDADVKSAYDLIYCIKTGNVERLRDVYKTQTSLTGDVGGYIVSEATLAEVMPTLNLNSGITERMRRIPVSTPSGRVPIPNLYTSITAGSGQTVEALGIASQPRSEGGAYTKETARLAQLEYRVYDALSGYVQVTREMSSYAPGIVNILTAAIQSDAVAKKEYMTLRGSGAGGEFLGVLNWDGAIGVTVATSDTFAYADMLNMRSKFINAFGSEPVFIAHPSLIPDIGQFEIGSNGAGVPSLVGTAGQLQTMPGTNIPVLYSQHLPQANSSGAVVLIDPQMYGIFEYGSLYIEYSREYDFVNGMDTWRFGQLVDGKPLMKDAVTLAGPGSAYTQSPVVYAID